MIGWATQISGEFIAPKGVIGIVVAQKFPEPDLIREKLLEGISRVSPDTVWIMRDQERKSHAATVAWDVFRECGIEPFLAPLNPAWKSEGYDLRAKWRDGDMRMSCERIIVFHDKSSGITADWADYGPSGGSECIAKIFVVERGKKKVVARKGRKPQGA